MCVTLSLTLAPRLPRCLFPPIPRPSPSSPVVSSVVLPTPNEISSTLLSFLCVRTLYFFLPRRVCVSVRVWMWTELGGRGGGEGEGGVEWSHSLSLLAVAVHFFLAVSTICFTAIVFASHKQEKKRRACRLYWAVIGREGGGVCGRGASLPLSLQGGNGEKEGGGKGKEYGSGEGWERGSFFVAFFLVRFGFFVFFCWCM